MWELTQQAINGGGGWGGVVEAGRALTGRTSIGVDMPGGEWFQVKIGRVSRLDVWAVQAKCLAIRLRQPRVNRFAIDPSGFPACRQAKKITANTTTEVGDWTGGGKAFRFVVRNPLVRSLFQRAGREKHPRGSIKFGGGSSAQLE